MDSGVVVKRKLSLGERLEQQRMEAAALFRAGKRVYEVAAEVGVAYATAHRWKVRWQKGGPASLHSRGKPGCRVVLYRKNFHARG
jgi:transposase-like protein